MATTSPQYDIHAEQPIDAEQPTVKRGRKPFIRMGTAAAVVIVPVVGIAAFAQATSGSPASAADITSCGESASQLGEISSAAKAEIQAAQGDLAVRDTSGLASAAENMGDYANAARDIDTAACDAVAPSFAPTVEKLAESWDLMALSFMSGDFGAWEVAADSLTDANTASGEAAILSGQVATEMEQAVAEYNGD